MPSAQARRKEIPCLIGNAQSAAQTTYARVGPSFAGNRGAAENQQSEWRGSESSHPHEDQCQARNWTKCNGGKKAGRGGFMLRVMHRTSIYIMHLHSSFLHKSLSLST